MVRGAIGAVMGALCAALLGCGAPTQGGLVTVAPGATERLLLAMRMGYAGAGEAKPPASVRRAVLDEQLPRGASGRLGDWVLENGAVIAVISAVDGSRRGGRLVDLVGAVDGEDELEPLVTRVLGRAVRYDALRTGTDAATGAAYVEVQGHVEGRPEVLVATRYDVAPELGAVVVHTQVRGARAEEVAPGEVAEGELAPPPRAVIEDEARFGATSRGALVVGAPAPAPPGSELARGHAAWVDGATGYVLRPLASAPIVVEARERGASVGVVALEGGEPWLHSRVIAPLERPDTLALGVALARVEGRPVATLGVRLRVGDQSVLDPGEGALLFRDASGVTLLARRPTLEPELEGFRIDVPLGAWQVGFHGARFHSVGASSFEARAGRGEVVDVVATGVLATERVPWAEDGCIPPSGVDPAVR